MGRIGERIQRSFADSGRAGSAWVITAYAIVFGVLLITGGRLADRYGRRRVFLAGLLLFAAGGAVCALAPAIAPLIAGRVVQAAGAACVMPAALGLLLAAYPDRRAQAVTLWSGIGALAVATGPSLGALLVHAWGWRAIFVLGPGVALVAAAVGAAVLPALPGTGGGRVDLPGVTLLVAGLAALVLAITRGNRLGLDGPPGDRVLRAGRRAARRLPAALAAAPGAGARPHVVPRAHVHPGQRGDRGVRRGLLRDAARQRAVPHPGVALAGAARGARGHAG
ncbi:MAG: MFS transporter, partial [Streptosporangiales bacterium]|nr:MFS transporter [Streptosporangiales bacterium]